jgi:hypothetical protein
MSGANSTHGEKRNAHGILVALSNGKRLFGRDRHRPENDIKMNLNENGCRFI